MNTLITIEFDNDVYEFGIRDNRLVRILLYENNQNYPKPIEYDQVPEEVCKQLLKQVKSSTS